MKYDFGTKEAYRRQFWNFADDNLDTPRKERHVLYLDSNEGLETRCLLKKGYRSENLHPCNWNAADAAILTRRMRAVGFNITSCGTDIFDAFRRLSSRGIKISAINFDFTSCLNTELLGNLANFTRVHTLDGCVIGLNMLRGRESRKFNLTEDSLGLFAGQQPTLNIDGLSLLRTDAFRLRRVLYSLSGYDFEESRKAGWSLQCLCKYHPMPFKVGSYRSQAGTQTMLWLAVKLRTPGIEGWLHDLKKYDMRRLRQVAEDEDVAGIIAPFCMVSSEARTRQKLHDELSELNLKTASLIEEEVKLKQELRDLEEYLISQGYEAG